MAYLSTKWNGEMYPHLIISAVSGPQHNPLLSLAKQTNINSIPMLKDARSHGYGGGGIAQSRKDSFWIIGTIFRLSTLDQLLIPKQSYNLAQIKKYILL